MKKIQFGGLGLNETASYGFILGSVGTAMTDNLAYFELPLPVDLVLGGGFEIYSSPGNSLSVEGGGGICFFGDEIKGYARIALIYKIYFN